MLAHLLTAAVNGLDVRTVEVEVNISKGTGFSLVGLPDSAVRESYTRTKTALTNSGFHFATNRIVVNLAPADLRKEGSGYDLPIAIGMLAAQEAVSRERLGKFMLVGELGLDGSLRPVRGALPIAIHARAEGFEGLIVPKPNVREAAAVNRLDVYGADNLKQVVDFFNGHTQLQPTRIDTRKEFYDHQTSFQVDFSEVRGQENVKRALEVAAAGGHNILLIGSPGCGKSMMAKRLPTILPPLTLSESLETTQIHSIAGILDGKTSLVSVRPFRSPHHTISDVALIGGGSNFMPGEISLAHNGVLFLDELPEFSRSALETMRQPLEDRTINITRTRYNLTLPCSFMLVASMNPCPCGYHNDPTHICTCSPGNIERYLSRISGPLLDRIDIQCEISAVPFKDISNAAPGEPSAKIRERVIKAREIQAMRYQGCKGIHCNAQMTERMIRQFAEPDEAGLSRLRMAMEKLSLSARAYTRILKVARTIADLEASEQIKPHHLAEAIGYRNLDRSGWAERGF